MVAPRWRRRSEPFVVLYARQFAEVRPAVRHDDLAGDVGCARQQPYRHLGDVVGRGRLAERHLGFVGGEELLVSGAIRKPVGMPARIDQSGRYGVDPITGASARAIESVMALSAPFVAT